MKRIILAGIAVGILAVPFHPHASARDNSGIVEPESVGASASTGASTKAGDAASQAQAPRPDRRVMWINHFDLLPGDPSVKTSFNAISSGVGGGLTGLVIQSSTLGEIAPSGGNKVVHMGLQVPPGYLITGVRVCYELSSKRSFISQIRLAQVQNPPTVAGVILDDPTDLTNPGPVCLNSSSTSVDPVVGEVLLSLRVNFGNTGDRIVVRALGLILASIP